MNKKRVKKVLITKKRIQEDLYGNEFKYEIEVLKAVLELSLLYPKELYKSEKTFSRNLNKFLEGGLNGGKAKKENQKLMSFLQGLIIFYFSSAWGFGKGLIRGCKYDNSRKKVRVTLIGERKIEFKKGEYDRGTKELFSLLKKIIWDKDISKEEKLNVRDINQIRKNLLLHYDGIRQSQFQLIKIAQKPKEIIKTLEDLKENIMPIFIFFACLPKKNMEQLFSYIANHLPSNYYDNLPGHENIDVSTYFSKKSCDMSEYFDKIRGLLFLYVQSKRKIIKEIVKIKTRDFLVKLFEDKKVCKMVNKTILDTIEGQFNPRLQLINQFSKVI